MARHGTVFLVVAYCVDARVNLACAEGRRVLAGSVTESHSRT